MARNFALTWSFPSGGGGGSVSNPFTLVPEASRDDICWEEVAGVDPTFNEPTLATGSTAVTVTNASELMTQLALSDRNITIPSGTSIDNSMSRTTCGSNNRLNILGRLGRLAIKGGNRITVYGSADPTQGYLDSIDISNASGSSPTELTFIGLKSSHGFGTIYQAQKVAFIDCVARGGADEAIFILQHGYEDLLFANCNFGVFDRPVHSGDHNEWVWRFDNSRDGAGDTSPPAGQRVYIYKCMSQTSVQACRLSGEQTTNRMRYFQTQQCVFVNTEEPNNCAEHDQDAFPLAGAQYYGQNNVYVYSDRSDPGNLSLTLFNANTAVYGSTAYVDRWHQYSPTFRVRTTNLANQIVTALSNMEAAGAANTPTCDLRYRGTRADPTATDGIAIVTDSLVENRFKHDNTAAVIEPNDTPGTGWRKIYSTYVLDGGSPALIGSNPYAIGA